MSDDRRIAVGETADGERVTLPVIEVLTGRGLVLGKSGSGKSVLGGTPVYTRNGRKAIEDVEEGEYVLSLNKQTYEQEFRLVQGTLEHEAGDLIEITLEDGTTLVGTEDHSFLTVENMEIVPIRGNEIEEGMWFPLARRLPTPETVTEIDLAEYVTPSRDIDVNDETIRSGPKTDDRYLDLDFSTGMVLGLYLAEGSFDSTQTVQISNDDDEIQKFLGNNGFRVYERTCNRAFKPFGQFVEAEFGRGSASKWIPDWVYETPESFRSGLLSGYFDGDGTVSDGTVTAMSKSEMLVEGLRELLRQFGISTTVRSKFTLYGSERREFKRLRIDTFSTDTFASVVELNVESKRARLDELVDQLYAGDTYNSKDMIPNFSDILNLGARERQWTKRDSENRNRAAAIHYATRKQKVGRATYNRFVSDLELTGRAKEFGTSDIQWKRVVSVESIHETRRVYDLDVKLNDNFIANGVFVHNSNTTSVVIEELLEGGFPVLIVDAEGEYYGLKEEYELLHAGADEECDIQVGPEHAERIARLSLDENVPVILDVSGYLDADGADALVRETARNLFAKEKKLKKPFLLVVEEIHEYLPEGGGMDETGRMLVKVGKRGRKHGLGIVGVSQRPADVKKDFITQANWLVWHRLTWENDTKVVSRVVGDTYADAAPDLDDGEAFVGRDWTDADVERVQFDRKRTFDAGATPGLDDVERPELKSVIDALVDDLQEISERRDRERDRIEELERELDARDDRIAELEAELETARNVSHAARQLAGALSDGIGDRPFGFEERLAQKNERIRELEAELDAPCERGGTRGATSGGADGTGDGAAVGADDTGDDAATDRPDGATADRPGGTTDERAAGHGSGTDGNAAVAGSDGDAAVAGSDVGRGADGDDVDAYLDRLRRKGERLLSAEDGAGAADEVDAPDGDGAGDDTGGDAGDTGDLVSLLHTEPVVARIDGAHRDARCNREHTWRAVGALAASGSLTLAELGTWVDTSTEAVETLLAEFRKRSLVTRDDDRRYALNEAELRRLAEDPGERAALGELASQWEV